MSDFALKVFYNVAKLQSFSAAGRLLYITQPAVSSQIKSIEDNFGARLFIRKPNEVILTRAGQVLFDYATKILALYEEAEEEIGKISESIKDKLTIGATSTIAAYYLPLIIASFKQKYPDVEIVTFVSNTQNVVRSMNEDIVDFCIVSEPVHQHRYLPRTFIRDELVLIVSPRHKWAGHNSITLEQLMKEPLILRETGSGTRATLQRYLKEKGEKLENFNVIMNLGTTGSVKASVERDVGVAFIPKTSIKLELEAGYLKIVNIENIPMIQTFTVLYPRGFTRPVLEAFFEFMQEFELN